MREILFRGKRVDNGEWVEGDLLTPPKEGFIQVYEISDTHSLMGDRYEVNPDTVGQFTGLTDKNGKKIFEGDIIICDTSTYRYVTGTVKYSENASCYYIKALNSSNDYMFNCDNILIIIGNIHDNPEWSEETK